jgi:hypothetical protein
MCTNHWITTVAALTIANPLLLRYPATSSKHSYLYCCLHYNMFTESLHINALAIHITILFQGWCTDGDCTPLDTTRRPMWMGNFIHFIMGIFEVCTIEILFHWITGYADILKPNKYKCIFSWHTAVYGQYTHTHSFPNTCLYIHIRELNFNSHKT